jgi:DNA-binding IclR family transcriptional regulator
LTASGASGRTPGGRPRTPTIIASVDKALAVLELFVTTGTELSVTRISRELGLNFSTAHHLVSTLAARGYLEQNPVNRHYRLGVHALTLGLAARDSAAVVGIAQPVVEALAAEVNEHVNLALVDGTDTIYVSQVLSSRAIAMFMRLGTRVPMYCTGVGKAVLAFMDEGQAEITAAAGGYRSFTAATARNWQQLNQDLREIRALGYAVDREEREEGVVCVAAPVFNHTGQPCGAVSVSGPSTRIAPRLEPLGVATRSAAARISAKLGYVQPAGSPQ